MDFIVPDSLWLSWGTFHSDTTISLTGYLRTLRPVYRCTQQLHWSIFYTEDEGKGENPIYFLAHKLSKTQGFAISYALQKLNHYLQNGRFTIKTDHKLLKYILDSPMQNKKIPLCAFSIARSNTQVEYNVHQKHRKPADFLSKILFKKGEKEEPLKDESTPEDKKLEID